MGKHAITGAFGFTGKYLAQRLLKQGHKVITLTNSPSRPHPFKEDIQAYPFHFNSPEIMAKSLEGVDVLYNTYWVRFNHTQFTHSTAVDNTKSLFEAAQLAGVKRIVHISITNADENSSLEYFSGKGHLERILQESGMSHAIIRPAVLFGPSGILINNIAWVLRYFPCFAMFGNGKYHIQPIFVDDLAELMAEQGNLRDNVILNALGEEDYTYKDLVKMIRKELGVWRPIVPTPPSLGYLASKAIGRVVGDNFVTKEEIEGLMADLLHVPGSPTTGKTKLSTWVRENKDTLGKKYMGELIRRTDRKFEY